jgi:hypothetical protein
MGIQKIVMLKQLVEIRKDFYDSASLTPPCRPRLPQPCLKAGSPTAALACAALR